MLSGEGNAGERWKTTIGLISKKATLHVQHTFFVRFFAVVLHDYNVKLPETSLVTRFMEEMSYVFSFNFFFHCPLIFTLHWWPLAFPILSPPLQNFHVVLPTKKCLLCFLSLALDLCRPFSCWASLACRLLSLFLCLSPALYSKFVATREKKNLCITLRWKKRIIREMPGIKKKNWA